MFKIDGATANPNEPLRTADGPNSNGAFDETLETIVSAEWLNAVQNEISNVVIGNSGSLDKQDDFQLFKTIRSLFNGMALSNFTERANPENSNLYSVVYGDNLFVAVGAFNGTDAYIATSPDGDVWTKQTNPESNNLHDVIYANNLYVAVGGASATDAYIVTSPDGVVWTERANPKATTLLGITFGNGLFVAVGNAEAGLDAYIVTSPDGIVWTERANPKATTLLGITFGNGLFVAVGNPEVGLDAYIVTSPDGIVWTERANPKDAALFTVTYGDGLYVAAGAYNIITSPDGLVWTERHILTTSADKIIYANGSFVIVGNFINSGNILTSQNGLTWVERATLRGAVIQGIAFGQGTYVTVGFKRNGDADIYTSLRLG